MPRVVLFNRSAIAAFVLALGCAGLGEASVAEPVVQPLPGAESRALNAALARIAANPRDAAALIDAGNAALGMNNVEAAIGFFTRAAQATPTDPRAIGGLAGAHLRNEDPFTAIDLFNDAERLGALSSAQLSDRGLAYDLVGDNITAQRYYRLAGPTNDEAVRRLALSLAIVGDRRGSEAALSPLISRQDKSAWRTRAFSLAILGDETQSISIVNSTMPQALASGIAPYLHYMRQLTRAQQAAAANLGHFPRASEIGRDDPRIAQYASRSGTRPDAGLVPAGQPLGNAGATPDKGKAASVRLSRQERREQERDARSARPAQQREAARAGSAERVRPPELVVAVSTTPPPVAAASDGPARAPSVAAPRSVPPPANISVTTTGPRGPSVTSPAGLAAASTPAAVPSSPPLPPASRTAAPPRPRSMAEAFGDIARPAASVAPAPGAVDIRRVTPPRPASAKPAVPAHPSRIWVQVATGRDKKALGFDWRRMAKDEAAVFRARKPYVTAWGQTSRLLTGPFETESAANAFLAQLRRADLDGPFLWTSPAGQVVDALTLEK